MGDRMAEALGLAGDMGHGVSPCSVVFGRESKGLANTLTGFSTTLPSSVTSATR
jgi:hypothetical protein